MKQIWKFPLKDGRVEMPDGAEILDMQVQHGKIVLWAIVDPKQIMVARSFRIIMTGRPFELDKKDVHIKTIHCDNGIVAHVFEIIDIQNQS